LISKWKKKGYEKLTKDQIETLEKIIEDYQDEIDYFNNSTKIYI
jgi:hypothetical protein